MGLLATGPADAQVIELEDAVREGGERLPIAIESPDSALETFGKRAFRLHGGYVLAGSGDAAFVIRLEGSGNSSVRLSILSGSPPEEQWSRTVDGGDRLDAVLRACDLAVEATSGNEGFFAGKLAFVGKQRGVSEIYVGDLLFRRVRPVTSDGSLVTGPSWSPDGDRLLYTSYHNSGFPDIFMIDFQSGRRKPVATYKGTNSGATFRPDGGAIAMVLSGAGNSEIYVGDGQGRNPRRLTENESLEASPTWAPDGRRIAFTSDAAGAPQIYEMPASGGPSRRLPTNVSRHVAEPAWNPVESNMIAFTAAVDGGFQIGLYDHSERSGKILTSVADSAVEPAWMNDGRHLVFTRRRGGREHLMLLDTETGKISALHNPNFGNASSADFVY